jgi:uncharacterized phage-associated protein
MVSIFDVASYITGRTGEMTAMKLQKLMYYAQAWNMVWDEEPLFAGDFQAWANGPVLPELYQRHRGMFKVDSTLFADGVPANLTDTQKQNIDRVLGFYGTKTAQWLSTLTHQEAPWLNARDGLAAGTVSDTVIEKAAMYEYYSSL